MTSIVYAPFGKCTLYLQMDEYIRNNEDKYVHNKFNASYKGNKFFIVKIIENFTNKDCIECYDENGNYRKVNTYIEDPTYYWSKGQYYDDEKGTGITYFHNIELAKCYKLSANYTGHYVRCDDKGNTIIDAYYKNGVLDGKYNEFEEGSGYNDRLIKKYFYVDGNLHGRADKYSYSMGCYDIFGYEYSDYYHYKYYYNYGELINEIDYKFNLKIMFSSLMFLSLYTVCLVCCILLFMSNNIFSFIIFKNLIKIFVSKIIEKYFMIIRGKIVECTYINDAVKFIYGYKYNIINSYLQQNDIKSEIKESKIKEFEIKYYKNSFDWLTSSFLNKQYVKSSIQFIPNGSFTSWFDNGLVNIKCNYDKGEYHGKYECYDNEGNKIIELNYNHDIVIDSLLFDKLKYSRKIINYIKPKLSKYLLWTNVLTQF